MPISECHQNVLSTDYADCLYNIWVMWVKTAIGGWAMRSSRNMCWQLFFIGTLALCMFGCNSAKRATTTAETDALLRAARLGNADTVKSLLTSPNVDVNGVDADGNTALIEAARSGHDDVVEALLIARANVNAKNKQGKTALMLASEGGHDECVRLLGQASR